MRRVELGGGWKKREGWINIDNNTMCSPDICRDLGRGFPFDDDSVDEIYSSNCLEHLNGKDLVFVIWEIQRVLKTGCVATIIVPLGVVPDLSHLSFFHFHSFDNLFEQPGIYGIKRLKIVLKERKYHLPPWDYVEMRIVLRKE